ncbi:TPA: hypothetical protein N0F65_005158 [Lagenidium giganteum]|uniref:FYVE-type domain-containing protein n=1 Tax=Lagenidium giganteum TaxID=4803 RepID=A0AAV2YST7_9STRA|nr:TPA: hypothetical protein N0F65_005158 [Lagenidium giganteum]
MTTAGVNAGANKDNNSAASNNNSTGNGSASDNAAAWPSDIDLVSWYARERTDVDDVIKDSSDLSVWTLEVRKDTTQVYVHCKNNEKLSYSVRCVTKVAGTVANVMECLRSPVNERFRAFQKFLHPKNFLDGEVLHADQRQNADMDSIALKWMAFSSLKALGRGKEFLVREYCTIRRNHPQFGTVGVCKFESYDGVGAKYNIRTRPDTYSLTVFEPSSIVVQQMPGDEANVQLTMTFAIRKARGENSTSVSSGVRLLALRMAKDMTHLHRAVQHTLFQPSALADKKEWVSDGDRSNCSLCMLSFGMLKRRHHCRVCGEVVCASCTVFKVVKGKSDVSKIRVCKACLNKPASGAGVAATAVSVSSVDECDSPVSQNRNPNQRPVVPMSMPNLTNPSICSSHSSASSSSDESVRPFDEMDVASQYLPTFKQSTSTASVASTMTISSKSSSFNDLDFLLSSNSHCVSPRSIADHADVAPRRLVHTSSSRSNRADQRIHYFNEDFEEICMLAMETLNCPMAGIRTEDFELVNYFQGHQTPELPRALPTFRRIASRGKPCIVLDVSSDKRISGEKRFSAKLQFFVGIPLVLNGEVVGDLCVADMYARETIEFKQIEVLKVLGETVTQYMLSPNYMQDLAVLRSRTRTHSDDCSDGEQPQRLVIKEVAF